MVRQLDSDDGNVIQAAKFIGICTSQSCTSHLRAVLSHLHPTVKIPYATHADQQSFQQLTDQLRSVECL
jgi:hypothetical protein